ncbi:PIN domain-like protein [Mycena alexandri]|uniref:PIN domain-like protein n=1 Tax=Mycena alexandri TaxID=1745969 RepID=A0AAD6T0H5_9AGAR|nr:PIN domain-like protein [Mycena alexandri]KAJ7046155.1 PIN domain-like protein [Mycena alexandri]
MGSPKLWEVSRLFLGWSKTQQILFRTQILEPAATKKSLLHLATTEGFQTDLRRQRTFIVGVDISIKIEAVVAALKAAGVYYPGNGGQKLVLDRFFHYFCNLCRTPTTPVFFFDGPDRPAVKRGTRVIHRSTPLVEHLKTMITSFGFYFYEAPGEAEAELAHLNANGIIDGILTEDSDAFIFGARCVIRTLGILSDLFARPSVENESVVYTLDAIASTEGVGLDQDGIFLCALILGGDYGGGLAGAGPTIARALAAHGLGHSLAHILRTSHGPALNQHLASWRQDVREELETNSSRQLDKRQPNLANNIPDDFPDVTVAQLYLSPLTSASARFTGRPPDANSWKPTSPNIAELTQFCSTQFGWTGGDLLKKFNATLWPGIAFKLISSVGDILSH